MLRNIHFTFLAFTLLNLFTSASASARALSLPLSHTRSHQSSIHLTKRDGTVAVDDGLNRFAESSGVYTVEASVGTPPQRMIFALDTGSSDTWMFAPGACKNDSQHNYYDCISPSCEFTKFLKIMNWTPCPRSRRDQRRYLY